MFSNNLVPVVYRLDLIEAFDRAARERGVVADVHVKVDTGMGRLGVRFDEVAEFATALKRFQNIRVDGLMTHFAAADESSCESLTREQIQRFDSAVSAFREHGFEPAHRHLANSAGIFGQPEVFGSTDGAAVTTWCGPAACSMDSGATSSRRRIAIRNSGP